jgi:hypothetical protein
VAHVQVAGGEEDVDARPRRLLDRLPGGVDVLLGRPRQPLDHRPARAADLARDRPHRLEVVGRRGREAGLDPVDAEPRQPVRDLQLLVRGQRRARRLLAVAERGVEDEDLLDLVFHG